MHITPDSHQPSMSVEIPIYQPLPDYDLDEITAPVPRDVDPMLASQGFLDLIDEARSAVKAHIASRGLELVQLTGAICSRGGTHRPGLWLVFQEADVPAGKPMSANAQQRVVEVAEHLRTLFKLG
jgi:hypothetical protein